MKPIQYIYKDHHITIEKSPFGFDALIFKNLNFVMGWRSLESHEIAKEESESYINALQGE